MEEGWECRDGWSCVLIPIALYFEEVFGECGGEVCGGDRNWLGRKSEVVCIVLVGSICGDVGTLELL